MILEFNKENDEIIIKIQKQEGETIYRKEENGDIILKVLLDDQHK